MSPEPAPARREFHEILDQLPAQNRAALDAARNQLAEIPQQGEPIAPEQTGQLPVGGTPNMTAKDLIYKYGREATPSIDRTRGLEPEQ